MKILGIDFGTVRLGIAIQLEGIQLPLKTVAREGYRERLKEVLAERDIDSIVIGLPISMSGRYSQSTMRAVSFAEKVKRLFGGKVFMVDERLTSETSKRVALQSEIDLPARRDTLSAMEILRNFSRDHVKKWEIKNTLPVCRDLVLPESGERVLLYKPRSASIDEIHSYSDRLGIYVEDPQVFLAFKKKKLNPVNLIDDLELSTYDIIVIARGDELERAVLSQAKKIKFAECSWLNG